MDTEYQMFAVSATARNCLSEKIVWLIILLTTVVCVVPGLAVSFLRVDLFPTLRDKVLYNNFDTYSKQCCKQQTMNKLITFPSCLCFFIGK